MIIFRCSSVSAINATTLKVVLATAPDADPTADKFTVAVNGTAVAAPTAIVKDLSDSTGKTYKLTIASLDKTSGSITVNGVAGTFDYAAPTISAVKALNNKQIEITFSEKVDQTTAEDITNYGIYAMGASGASLVTFTVDDGAGAAGTEIDALAKQTADNKVVITIGSVGSTVANQGYVLGGLTNGEYLLYANNIKDASTNANVIVANSNKQFTGTTTPDSAEAQVLTAGYSTGSGVLSIGFDKTMKVDKAFTDATKISITNGTTTVALTSADVDVMTTSADVAEATSIVATGVKIPLTAATKAKVDALGTSNLSVVLGEGAFKDATNSNNSATVTKALTLSLSPLVTSAEYNEDTNVLKLNFNMDIDVSKIASLTGITVNVQAIGANATVKTTTNGSVVEIQLDAAQAAAMETAAAINTNTVTTATVVVPANLFTKVGATSTDPGLNAAATLTTATVVQDTVVPTITSAKITGLTATTGTLQIVASEPLSTTITKANIAFYASDNLTTPIGDLGGITAATLTLVPGTTSTYSISLDDVGPGTLEGSLNTAVTNHKNIVMTVSAGAIKDANLTDIAAVSTTAPIAISVAETNYGVTPDTFAVATQTPNLVTATFKKSGADVQLDKTIAEDTTHYQFVSIANPNVKVNVSAANYVWGTTTGELRLTPATPLVAGTYKLTMTGLKTNAGVKVDDSGDATSDNLVTINTVTIIEETVKPTVSNSAEDITLNDVDNSGTVSAGDKIIIKFSEPVKLNNVTGADFTVSNSHSLGSSGIAVDSTDNTKVVITLSSDATIAIGDTITAKTNTGLTDLNGNVVDGTTNTTATLAVPSIVTIPEIKSETYVDANNSGAIDKGDTLTIVFDQLVKADAAANLKDDITIGTATFSDAVLSNDTLTLTIDTPTGIAVGSNAVVNTTPGNVDITNAWGNKAVDDTGVAITSADTTAPKVVSMAYGTEGSNKFLYITLSEAVHLTGASTFADSFEIEAVNASTGVIKTTDEVTLDSNDATNKTLKVALTDADDNVIPGLTIVNVKLNQASTKAVDAAGNKLVKSLASGYTVTQK